MLSNRVSQYIAVSLVGCVTAAVMLVAFDFAGWETVKVDVQTRFRYSADPVDIFRTRVRTEVRSGTQYYVSSINVFGPYIIVIAPVVALLLYGAYVSFRGLKDGARSLSRRSLNRAYRAALVAAVVALARIHRRTRMDGVRTAEGGG